MDQIIIHVDMDAFYASVEVRDNPALKGKPLIIGSMPSERGVVATCSYEARKYGVHSAMNIKEAYRLCPGGIYMHPHFEKYKAVSAQIHQIWEEYATAVESVALDEAYLDVTLKASDFAQAGEIGRLIKKRVLEEVGLTCSVGVAYSKTAAKTASEENKPNGYFEIPNKEAYVDLVIDRPVDSLYTVGAKTAEKLSSYGIVTVRDIQEKKNMVLESFGKQGEWICRLAFGEDDRPVTPYRPEDAKSISRECTFQEDVEDFELLKDCLLLIALCVENRAKRIGLYGNGVSLKITYSDMKSITRSKVCPTTRDAITIYREACQMADSVEQHKVRLIGCGIYNLSGEEGRQLSLEDWISDLASQKEKDLQKELVRMGEKYGLNFVGNIEKLFHHDVLYKTLEYMRKKTK